MKLLVDDFDIAYDRAGSGEPVVLVMGLGTTRIGWFNQFRFLQERYDVTAFDNRGVGESGRAAGDFALHGGTASANSFFDGEQADSPGFMGQLTAIMNWSLHGGTAARLGEITAPALVLHGAADNLVPLPNGQLLAGGIPGARF